VVDRG